jgi:serine/threonine protein kinase
VQDPFGLIGSVLGGKYRLEGVLGEGGFGVVYAGRQVALDQPVAVKCLKPTGNGHDVASFLREAKVLFRLSHPGIVRMYDVGEVPTALGVVPYVVLERLAGRTLDDEIEARAREGRPFVAHELVHIADGLLEAVAFAHAQGVVHRDLKPANVMLVPQLSGSARPRSEPAFRVKILDFGLARASASPLASGIGTALTASAVGGSLGGSTGVGLTPRYAAPEQWDPRFGVVGPPTDLFALGLVLEEAATLSAALPGETVMEVMAASTSPARRSQVRARRPDLSPAFADLVDVATRVAQSERFPSAEAMREALLGPTIRASYGPARAASVVPGPPTYAPPSPSPLAHSGGGIPGPRPSPYGPPTSLSGSQPYPVPFQPSVPPGLVLPSNAPPPVSTPQLSVSGPTVYVHPAPMQAAPVYDRARGKESGGGLLGGVLAGVVVAGFFGLLVLGAVGYGVYRVVVAAESRPEPQASSSPSSSGSAAASAATSVPAEPTPAISISNTPAPRATKPVASGSAAPGAPVTPSAAKSYRVRIDSFADLGDKEAEVKRLALQVGNAQGACFDQPGVAGRNWTLSLRKQLYGEGLGVGRTLSKLDGVPHTVGEGGPSSDLHNCADIMMARTKFPVPPPVKLPDGGTRVPYIEITVGRF